MYSGLKRLDDHINSRYGTIRGLVRLALTHLKLRGGHYRQLEHIDWPNVRRLVYVCQGNICRSAFAHQLARKTLRDVEHASIGIATTTGVSADAVATRVARSFDVDLQVHRAIDLTDFEIMDGDVFLLMEDRHLVALEPALRVANRKTQVVLLGLWSTPKFPLIYDPFRLSEGYFQTCFSRIRSALRALEQERLQHAAHRD